MKLSKIEYLNKGYADTITLQDVKQERKNLITMLFRTGNKDYTFADGSIFNALEARNRIEEIDCYVIPKLHKEMTESRWNNLICVTGGI